MERLTKRCLGDLQSNHSAMFVSCVPAGGHRQPPVASLVVVALLLVSLVLALAVKLAQRMRRGLRGSTGGGGDGGSWREKLPFGRRSYAVRFASLLSIAASPSLRSSHLQPTWPHALHKTLVCPVQRSGYTHPPRSYAPTRACLRCHGIARTPWSGGGH